MAGGTLNALVLVDDGFTIYIQRDGSHRADGVTVATPNAFSFIYVHEDLSSVSFTAFMMNQTSLSSQDDRGNKKIFSS
jgi:hypothetical protein